MEVGNDRDLLMSAKKWTRHLALIFLLGVTQNLWSPLFYDPVATEQLEKAGFVVNTYGCGILATALNKRVYPRGRPAQMMLHRGRELSSRGLDEFVSTIRENVLISSMVSHYTGQQLSSAKSQICLCPFHDDKNPSMGINDEKGLFHCFSCKASGDTIKFVQDIESVSFIEALRSISKVTGLDFRMDSMDGHSPLELEKFKQRDRIEKVRSTLLIIAHPTCSTHISCTFCLLMSNVFRLYPVRQKYTRNNFSRIIKQV